MPIKKYRTLKGITQAELARRVGITRAYLCQLEKGNKKNPSAALMLRIANELNVSINTLLTESAA